MSNLLVQNIKHTNNTTSMAIDTSGQVSVRGEGSATTTNLQQGLCKSWQDLNGETFGSRDSFNVSGNTDHGTGSYTNSYSNSMSDGDYHFSGYCGDPNQQMAIFHITATSDKVAGSTKYVTNFINNTSGGGANLDCEQIFMAVHGDLA